MASRIVPKLPLAHLLPPLTMRCQKSIEKRDPAYSVSLKINKLTNKNPRIQFPLYSHLEKSLRNGLPLYTDSDCAIPPLGQGETPFHEDICRVTIWNTPSHSTSRTRNYYIIGGRYSHTGSQACFLGSSLPRPLSSGLGGLVRG